jgi:hypothetical protein
MTSLRPLNRSQHICPTARSSGCQPCMDARAYVRQVAHGPPVPRMLSANIKTCAPWPDERLTYQGKPTTPCRSPQAPRQATPMRSSTAREGWATSSCCYLRMHVLTLRVPKHILDTFGKHDATTYLYTSMHDRLVLKRSVACKSCEF